MDFREEVLQRVELGDALRIARAIFADHGADLEDMAARLNRRYPDLAPGDFLRYGVICKVQEVLRFAGTIRTPAGEVPKFNHDNFAAFEEERELVRQVDAAVKPVYQQNAYRFAFLLDRTPSWLLGAAKKAKMLSNTYAERARAFTWLAREAKRRGCGADEPIRKVFTPEEIEAWAKGKEEVLGEAA